MMETLFLEHRQRACRYARWLVGNESDAEELVQEAFLRLAKRQQTADTQATNSEGTPGTDQPISNTSSADIETTQAEVPDDQSEKRFAGLLFTTVRNLSIDLLRKKGRRKDVSLTSVGEPVATNHEAASLAQLNGQIRRLMDELPDHWAEALKLKIAGDLSYEDIAKVLDCTKAQVRTWIFRARKQLAKELTRNGWLEIQT